jgi:hypothetical protein
MNKRGIAAEVVLVATGVMLLPTVAMAAETITYSYDAKGRLVKVERTGTVNNNVKAEYAHDKADNRTNVTVTGSPNASPPP